MASRFPSTRPIQGNLWKFGRGICDSDIDFTCFEARRDEESDSESEETSSETSKDSIISSKFSESKQLI